MAMEIPAKELVTGMRVFIPNRFNDGGEGHWETVQVATIEGGMREYSAGGEFMNWPDTEMVIVQGE